MTHSPGSVRLAACDCLTPFGAAEPTLNALLRGERALQTRSALGSAGGDLVPLALMPGRQLDDTAPPAWRAHVHQLAQSIPGEGWGTARRPVFVTSSNFGVGSLVAFRRTNDPAHLPYAAPFLCVDWLRHELGWESNVSTLSHACVSAHLGLLQASRWLATGAADAALIFSFDFLSPFVAGGFNSLKILNEEFPAPYENRPMGAIGLGDGVAFAVLTRESGDFALRAQFLHNELHHFTANRSDGSGFDACLAPLLPATAGKRIWIKGHGTGTLEAGRLEAEACTRHFPDSALVGWKGSLGHTLGSCGLVELAITTAAIRAGRAPGTVGCAGSTFAANVALDSFDIGDHDGVVCASNAFGGAHATFLLEHA